MTQLLYALLWTGLLLCALGLVRNEWVYRARMGELCNPNRSIAENVAEHDRLPSYDTMVLRWWVWDVEKFKDRV